MTWANFTPWYFLAVMMDHLIGVMYASIGQCRLNQPIGGCGRANGRAANGRDRGRLSWRHLMSAIGTKRTCDSDQLMSAFGGKADIPDLTSCLLLTQSGIAGCPFMIQNGHWA